MTTKRQCAVGTCQRTATQHVGLLYLCDVHAKFAEKGSGATRVFSIRVPLELADEMDGEATREGIARNRWILHAIREKVQRRLDGLEFPIANEKI